MISTPHILAIDHGKFHSILDRCDTSVALIEDLEGRVTRTLSCR